MTVPNIHPLHVDSINRRFGVFSGTVTPPETFVCDKNDRVYSRFFYVTKGCIIFDRGTENELHIHAGEIVYLPSDITYRSEWDTASEGAYIALHFILDEFYVHLPDRIALIAADPHGIYLDMFEKLLNSWKQGALGYEFEVLSGIYRVMHQIYIDSVYHSIKAQNSTILPSILYLENHYLEDVTVEQLAALSHTSVGNFRRLFKRYSAMPPITYRNYLRVKKAIALMESGSYNVSQAADAVNIPDHSYFHQLFRQFFQCSPKEYLSLTRED